MNIEIYYLLAIYINKMFLCCCTNCVIKTILSFIFYFLEDVSLVEFRYLVFTCMSGESYNKRLRSLLLSLCDGFRALFNNTLMC